MIEIINRMLKNIDGIGNRDLFIGSLVADLYMRYDNEEIDMILRKAVKISNEDTKEIMRNIEKELNKE